MQNKKVAIIFTIISVMFLGAEYVIAADALLKINSMTLLFSKYILALIGMMTVKVIRDRDFSLIEKQDLPRIILSCIAGEVLYYLTEYTAIQMVAPTLVSVISALVPIIALFGEKIFFKKKIQPRVVVGICVSVVALCFVLKVDFGHISLVTVIGYILAFISIFCWAAYSLITATLVDKYDPLKLTISQLICTSLMISPYVLHTMPTDGPMILSVMPQIVTLAVFAGLGFVAQVNAYGVIGPTTTLLFLNFAPVCTAILDWIVFGNVLTPVQIIAGIIVIAAVSYVIIEKDKSDTKLKEQE